MLDPQHEEYLELWQPDFRLRSYNYRNGPTNQHPCRDVCCLVVGAILFVCFLSLGIYTILEGTAVRTMIIHNAQTSLPKQLDPVVAMLSSRMGQFAIVISSMVTVSAMLSVCYTWLLFRFPKCMVYAAILLVTMLIAAITACCFIYDGDAVGVIVLVMLIVWLLVMSCCYRRYLTASICLAKIAGIFSSQRKSCILTSTLAMGVAIVLALFWAASITGIVFIDDQWTKNLSLPRGFYVMSGMLFLFIVLWVGYAQTFLTASHVARWYYKAQCAWWLPLVILFKSHLGSITFASLIITLIKLVGALSSPTKRDDNTCKKVCRCIFHSSLSVLEGFVHSMNHYGLIMAALQGDSFTSGSKSAGVLYYSYPGSFTTVNLIDKFFSLVGIFLCVGVPTLLAVLLMSLTGRGDISTLVGIVGSLASILSCIVMVGTVKQTISSIFVFFCLQKKLKDNRSEETTEELVQHFKAAFEGHENIGELLSEQEVNRTATKKRVPTGILSMPRLKQIAGKLQRPKSQKKITIKTEQTSECSISKHRPHS